MHGNIMLLCIDTVMSACGGFRAASGRQIPADDGSWPKENVREASYESAHPAGDGDVASVTALNSTRLVPIFSASGKSPVRDLQIGLRADPGA
jgi:hypothetical protein